MHRMQQTSTLDLLIQEMTELQGHQVSQQVSTEIFMNPEEDLQEVVVTLPRKQLEALTQVASAQDMTVSDVLRHCADIFLDVNEEDPTLTLALSGPLQRMEHRLLRMLAKSLQINGQALYFASLPWMAGPPQARLNDEGLAHHWSASQNMAAKLIRPKHKPDQEIKNADEG